MKLSDTISYANQAIVSQQIARTEKVEITLFACDEGQRIHAHQIPTSAWVRIEEGTLEVMVGETWYTLQAGDFLAFPANTMHALYAKQRGKFLLIREL